MPVHGADRLYIGDQLIVGGECKKVYEFDFRTTTRPTWWQSNWASIWSDWIRWVTYWATFKIDETSLVNKKITIEFIHADAYSTWTDCLAWLTTNQSEAWDWINWKYMWLLWWQWYPSSNYKWWWNMWYYNSSDIRWVWNSTKPSWVYNNIWSREEQLTIWTYDFSTWLITFKDYKWTDPNWTTYFYSEDTISSSLITRTNNDYSNLILYLYAWWVWTSSNYNRIKWIRLTIE